jgi:hypothetical protein
MLKPIIEVIPYTGDYEDLDVLVDTLNQVSKQLAENDLSKPPYICYGIAEIFRTAPASNHEAQRDLCRWIAAMLEDAPCLEIWLLIRGYRVTIGGPVSDWPRTSDSMKRSLINYRQDWLKRMIAQLESQALPT